MWPLSTVTEPKRRIASRTCRASSVPQFHFGYTVQRGVRKNDEWRAGGPGLQIFCDPGQLIIPQLSPLGADIDQPYEMNPSVRSSAADDGILPIALSILPTVVSHDVVLAGGVEGLAGSGLAQDWVHGVELVGPGVMVKVAGMQNELGRSVECVNFFGPRARAYRSHRDWRAG
jgi:hypothetical protein